MQGAECTADPQVRQGRSVLIPSAGQGWEGRLPSDAAGVRPFSVPWTLVRSHLADERTEASEVKGHPWVIQTITGQIQNVHSTCPWVPPIVLRAQARGSVLGLSIKGGPALSPGRVCQARWHAVEAPWQEEKFPPFWPGELGLGAAEPRKWGEAPPPLSCSSGPGAVHFETLSNS